MTEFDPTDSNSPALLRALHGLPPETPDELAVENAERARREHEAARAYETAYTLYRCHSAALGAPPPVPSLDGSLIHSALGVVDRERPPGPVRAVSVGTLVEPPPREWTVAGVVPEGSPTILAGHSGLGKSYIALLTAICVCVGRPFLGREVRRGNVLWVDRELDQDETARRAYAVARGLGMDRPPEGLFYLRPPLPIGTDETQELVLDAISEHDVRMTVLDSLTLGSVGDAKEQKDVVAVMRHIEEWDTSLLIDHITKSAAAGNQSGATIFGSGMKRAAARSTFLLTPAGDGLALRPDKSNFGPASAPLYLTARHDRDEADRPEVVFEKRDGDDPALAGAEDHAPTHEQTLLALQRLHRETMRPVPLATLAAEREIKATTVRNHLTRLGSAVVKHGDSTYSPAPSPDAHGGESPSEPEGGEQTTVPPSRPPQDDSPFTPPMGEGTGESAGVDPWLAEDPA